MFAGPSSEVLEYCQEGSHVERIGRFFYFDFFVIGETKMATVQPSAEFPASVRVYLSRNLSDSQLWGGEVRILLARQEWNKNKPGVKTEPAEVCVVRVFAVCVRAHSARARSCT